MNEFDLILEECVDLIASGDTTLEECLLQYPEYAAQLEPVLITAVSLQEEGRDIVPSSFLRSRIRGELKDAMKNNPQQKSRFPVFFWHKALNVSLLMLVLAMSSTLLAQGALPGEALYNWKLASERLWHAMAIDPLGTELKISDRRIHEYVAVSADEQRRTAVLVGYNNLLVHFKDQQDEANRARIISVLKNQQESLHKMGLSIPELESYFSGAASQATP